MKEKEKKLVDEYKVLPLFFRKDS
jgi:hypothetical protein